MLYTVNSKIVCPNTMVARLGLAFEELLPQIRNNLFPEVGMRKWNQFIFNIIFLNRKLLIW